MNAYAIKIYNFSYVIISIDQGVVGLVKSILKLFLVG